MGCETQHLFIVESTCTDAYQTLESTYSSAKDKYAPDVVKQVLATVESYAKPVFDFGQNTAWKGLVMADKGVDRGVNMISSAAEQSRKTAGQIVGEERLKPLDNLTSKASQVYKDGSDMVKDQGVLATLNTGFKSLISHIQHFASGTKEYVGNANSTVKSKLDDAYSNVYSKWIVPTVDKTGHVYMVVHDKIVSQPLYANLYNFTTVVYSHVSSWAVVRTPLHLSHEYLYPVVKPVMGPFVDRFAPYSEDVKKHLQPQAEPADVQAEVQKNVNLVKKKTKQATSQVEQQAKAGLQQVNLNGGSNGKSLNSKVKESLPNSQ